MTEPEDESPQNSEMQMMHQTIPKLTDLVTNQSMNAIKPPASPTAGTRDRGRDRERCPQRSPGQRPGRSQSPSRLFLAGWGKRCNHCGSDKHLKRDCKEFDEMMRKANVGVAKD